MKPEFSQQIVEKELNIKFHENPSSGSRVFVRGQTDGHDEANSAFRNFAKTPNNYVRNGTAVYSKLYFKQAMESQWC